MNPNNRAPGVPPPAHPDFGNPFQPLPGEARRPPPGAVVRDGIIVQHTMRGNRPFVRMRPVDPPK